MTPDKGHYIADLPRSGQLDANRETFLWATMEGEILRLREMDTKHIFNSMKMIFNHLAQEYGVEPVWFTKEYGYYIEKAQDEPHNLALLVCIFIAEIEARRDLPEKYHEPYAQILSQLTGIPLLPAHRSMLPAASMEITEAAHGSR